MTVETKKKIYILLGILGFLVVVFIGANLGKSHTQNKQLAYQHNVTKAINHQTNPDLIVYNQKDTNLKLIKSRLLTGAYKTVTLAIYSDTCKRCNTTKDEFASILNSKADSENLVIAINDQNDQNYKDVAKYFKLPEHFSYPTLFVYEGSVEHNKFVLKSQNTLFQ